MQEDEGFSDFSSESSESGDNVDFHELRKKNENYLDETVPLYSREVFFEHFRLSRNLVYNLSDTFENSQYFHRDVGEFGKISALHQILIFLWYVGHQTCSFRDVGDRFNISLSSVHRVLRRVTFCLSNLAPQIIKWPNEEEKRLSEQAFRNKGFPNVFGAIDGTHIKLDKPTNDPDSYINRKGYYSIHMQGVCDSRMRLIDVVIGFPGSVHDSRVFRRSSLGNNLAQKCGNYFLLGDSGYPLQTHLLTPFKNRGNLTRQQENYNVRLSQNRYIIEHCFGLLKQKFRQLYHCKLRNITFFVHFIRAACVLHNIAIDDEINEDNQFVEVMNDGLNPVHGEIDEDNEVEPINARVIRDRVVNEIF